MNATTEAKAIPVLRHGDRISIRMKNYRGERNSYADNFTVGSVAGYAEEYKEDPQPAIDRALRLGHKLYYAFNEGVMISAHPLERPERLELSIGDLVEFDGNIFRIHEVANRQIELREC